uniref:hypothetical protein n=1 Tax=Phenylobacterium sp. TaxID=1871053 RepID=UPI003784C79F
LAACAAPYASAPREPLPMSLAAAPPPGTALASGECFRTSDIEDHRIADPRTLLLRVRRNDVYRVGMSGNCLAGALSSDPLLMRSPPGATIACRPLELDIGVIKNNFTSPCLVDSIVKLTPDQVASLPPRLRP